MRHFAAFVRLSENLAWRFGTLAAVFLFFSAIGFMFRNGSVGPESVGMMLVLVVGLQLGAIARASYFYHHNIPFADTPAAAYEDRRGRASAADRTQREGTEEHSFLTSLLLVCDACISHPILGTVQPLLCMFLAAGAIFDGAGRLIVGPGWGHLIGLGMIAAGWLGIVGCWAAFLHRIGLRSPEVWLMVQEQVRKLRR